ncbi:hypothetical protein CK203_095124 [Vitis vinifera]|uniref:Uncharacterized protein n=1 Tax=Vitis vinifera TaxID=29760 RepID=A0A438DRM5_VITVI|nr:hypothetical protein CK203_095124 [Vitis vinifera]
MSESIIPVICFCKGKMLRTETDVKYIGDLAVIVPLYVPVGSTYEQLLSMIYSRTGIDKKQFQLVLNCRYPLKRENRFQPCPIWDDNSLSQNVEIVAMTYECRADENEEECESQEGDDQTLHEAMESEQGRYVSVDRECCDMSNNPDPDDPVEYSPVQYHSAPSLQFENVENIGNAVSSDWTPWGNTNIGNSGGEFMVGQVFNSKADLQHAAKLYSLSQHQEYVVVSSTTKLLVLRCKKAEQS